MNTDFPKPVPIQGVPDVEPTAPSVPAPVDHEKIKLGIAPGNQWFEPDTFCNTLPPAPRSQLINYPIRKKNCPKYKSPQYDPKKCYFTYNKDQNIPGMFCGGSNGSGNSNFVRGNQFSNDYCPKDYVDNSKNNVLSIGNYELDIKGKRIQDDVNEYTIQATKPVQIKMEDVLFKNNPTVVSDSPFYPYPNYKYTKDKEYRTYPHAKHYDENGMPIYTDPYNPLGSTQNSSIIENFTNGCTNSINSRGLWIAIIVLIAIIIVMFLVNNA